MRGFLNSVLATLVVLVLLIVAPLIAVFGIPEFVPVVASSSQAVTEPERPTTVGVGESARFQPNDLFAGFEESVPVETAAAFDVNRIPARPRTDSFSTSYDRWDVDERGRVIRAATTTETSSTTESSFDEYRIGDTVSVDGPSPASRPDVPEPLGVERVSWQSAVRRLNELGISDYSLTAGGDGRDFQFTCSYQPVGDERAGRRFRAEAPEPLLAVRHVLLQIDAWNARRR